MTRQEANLQILEILKALIEGNPDMRFHQLLWAYDITERDVDKFYEESTRTLSNLKANL
jgi:hypothetical protein